VPSSRDAKRITSAGLFEDTGGREFQRVGISSANFHSELLYRFISGVLIFVCGVGLTVSSGTAAGKGCGLK
jgi:hypothetical protein